MITNPADINAEAAKRNAEVKDFMDANGFARMPDIFAPGTMLYAGGNAFQAQRKTVEEMDDVEPGVERFRAQIKAEKRIDFDVSIPDLRMVAGGFISHDGGLALPEERSFKRLASIVTPPGGSQYLTACPPNVRMFNFNFWAGHPVNTEETCKLRTRDGTGQRKVFAVTSQTYGKFDVDEVAAVLAQKAYGDAKFSVVYDGVRAQMDLLYVTPIEDDRLVGTGELFKIGTRVTTADDGSERIRVYSTIWRGMCRNFGIIDESSVDVGSVVHRGSTSDANEVTRIMAQRVGDLLDAAHGKVGKYLDAWIEAGQDKILGDSETSVEGRLKKLVEKGFVKVTGCDKTTLTNRLLSCWQKEPGYTRQSLVNAVSRLHEHSWASPWATHEIEQQASQLVYVHNLNLN